MAIATKLTVALGSVMDALNVMGSSKEREAAVREFFSRQHRTLQQQFVAVIILPVLRHLADMYHLGYVDGRNQAAATLAAKMLAAVTEDDTYLPMI